MPPSTQKIIIEKCRQVRDLAETIKEQSPIPDVPDLCLLISSLAQQLEYVAAELGSAEAQTEAAFGTIVEHVEGHHGLEI